MVIINKQGKEHKYLHLDKSGYNLKLFLLHTLLNSEVPLFIFSVKHIFISMPTQLCINMLLPHLVVLFLLQYYFFVLINKYNSIESVER